MADHVLDFQDAADEIVGGTLIGFDQLDDQTYVLHVRNGQPLKIKSLTPISFFTVDEDDATPELQPMPVEEDDSIGTCHYCGFAVPKHEMCKNLTSASECAGAMFQ